MGHDTIQYALFILKTSNDTKCGGYDSDDDYKPDKNDADLNLLLIETSSQVNEINNKVV